MKIKSAIRCLCTVITEQVKSARHELARVRQREIVAALGLRYEEYPTVENKTQYEKELARWNKLMRVSS